MTRTTNARVAGVTFLFYITAGVTSLVLFGWRPLENSSKGVAGPARPRVASSTTAY
jgi:hypothetical protein